MSQNLADGLRADRAPGTVGAARRRRDRRLRAFLKHERVTVAMNLATVQHHSHMKSAVVDVGVQVGSPLAPVTEYVTPAPAVSYGAPAPVVGFVSPAPAVTYAAPASVFEYVAPAPVFEYIAPTPAVSFVAPSQQLRPAYSAAAVTTGVNLDAAVKGSASQVVGSLPHGEVFAAPVFYQVHQEQLAGGEIPENLVEISVVQKQVIVQASPHVVGSLPPVAEFTSPMYNPVHHEQFSAGDTAEDFAIFPVVQEQVLVEMRPAPPSEVAGPQGAAATVGYVAAAGPLLVPPVLGGGDTLDDATVSFLLAQSLLARQELEEMVAAAKRREEVRLVRKEAKAVRELLLQKERKMARIDRLVDAGRPVPADDLAEWQAWHASDHTAPSMSSSGKRRKRKKRRRRRTRRTWTSLCW